MSIHLGIIKILYCILPMEEGMFNIALFARLRNFKFCRLSILSGTDVMRLSERSSISNVLMVTIISGSCSEFQVEVHFLDNFEDS